MIYILYICVKSFNKTNGSEICLKFNGVIYLKKGGSGILFSLMIRTFVMSTIVEVYPLNKYVLSNCTYQALPFVHNHHLRQFKKIFMRIL